MNSESRYRKTKKKKTKKDENLILYTNWYNIQTYINPQLTK